MSELSWMEACIRAMSEHAWYEDGFSSSLRQAALERDLGQAHCIGGHENWWIPDSGCPWCRAVV